jgi:hypothetical protein
MSYVLYLYGATSPYPILPKTANTLALYRRVYRPPVYIVPANMMILPHTAKNPKGFEQGFKWGFVAPSMNPI